MSCVSGLVHMFEYHALQYKDANIGYAKKFTCYVKKVYRVINMMEVFSM